MLAERAAESASRVNGAFTRASVAQLAAVGPGWLHRKRVSAWEAYSSLPMPSTREEAWRYLDPNRLALDSVTLASAQSGSASLPAGAEAGPGSASAGRVVQVDGSVALVELAEEYTRQGVVLLELGTAAWQQHSDLVREHLGTVALPPQAGKFAALNGALWTAGVFLFVPRGVTLAAPIRISRWLGRPGSAVMSRVLVVAEEGSEVTVVDESVSASLPEPTLHCIGHEVFVKPQARVRHIALQRWGSGVRELSMQRFLVGQAGRVDTLVAGLGASLSRVDVAARLEGRGAHSEMLGLYLGAGDQEFHHNVRQDHLTEQGTSDVLYKGALHDAARSVFRGLIRVHPGAQRTDAYQTNRNLLLSAQARADALPNLEIEADDVRCSHGATVGQLDDEEIFYLISRGLTREQAQRLVVSGFLNEVLDRLALPDLATELRSNIADKIRGHDG